MTQRGSRRAIRVPGALAPAVGEGGRPNLLMWPTESTVSPSGIHGRTFAKLTRHIVDLVKRFADDYDDADDWASAILQAIANRRGGTDPRFLDAPGLIVNYVKTALTHAQQDRQKTSGNRQRLEGEYGVAVEVPRYEQLMPETEFEERVCRAAMERGLAVVSDERRDAFLSVRERGNSYDEAAAELGISARRVRNNVKLTQAAIRAYFPAKVAS